MNPVAYIASLVGVTMIALLVILSVFALVDKLRR